MVLVTVNCDRLRSLAVQLRLPPPFNAYASCMHGPSATVALASRESPSVTTVAMSANAAIRLRARRLGEMLSVEFIKLLFTPRRGASLACPSQSSVNGPRYRRDRGTRFRSRPRLLQFTGSRKGTRAKNGRAVAGMRLLLCRTPFCRRADPVDAARRRVCLRNVHRRAARSFTEDQVTSGSRKARRDRVQ